MLNLVIEKVMPKVINAARMLKEQLEAEGIRVHLSDGCVAAFAQVASSAAMQTSEKADDSYIVRLQREMQLVCRFIRQWTESDEPFDPLQASELISIARGFALPRPWKVTAPVSSVRPALSAAHGQ